MSLGMTRPNIAILIASLAWILGLTVRANEKPTEEYRKAMKDLEAASEIMVHHSRMVEPGGDFGYAWIESDAANLKVAFETARAYWAARNVKGAVRFAENAVSDATILERAAKAKHYDGVVAGVGGVLADCEPCHLAYREQLPDGTFEIR
jgi:cytochrome c556